MLVELAWRRTDPPNNAVKLFRHLADGALDVDGRVLVVQIDIDPPTQGDDIARDWRGDVDAAADQFADRCRPWPGLSQRR